MISGKAIHSKVSACFLRPNWPKPQILISPESCLLPGKFHSITKSCCIKIFNNELLRKNENYTPLL